MPQLRLFIVLSLTTALAAASGAKAQQPQFGDDARIVRAYFDDPILAARAVISLDALESEYEKGYIVLRATEEEIELARRAGLRIVEDDGYASVSLASEVPAATVEGTIPGYSCYRTVEGTYAAAQAIVSEHPSLATWTSVGKSWKRVQDEENGYDLYILKLTNSATSGTKPALMITAALHARELTTAELALRFAEYLADSYETDADTRWLLDHQEVHIMLQVNPDGRKRAEEGLYWRKNHNTNHCPRHVPGVDLNRNFDFHWGLKDAPKNECSEAYRGVSAASEPETQAVSNYAASLFPDARGPDDDDAAPEDTSGVFLDIHSHGRLVLWPWGHTDKAAPNGTALQTLGRKIAYFNGYTPIQSVGLYPTSGTADDYGYGVLGRASIAYELGTRFFQSCSDFENSILDGNLQSLLYAFKVARTPYLTPAGPDAQSLSLSDDAATSPVARGTSLTLSATLDDTRYRNSHGTEPTHDIAAAEYYVDVPPWATGAVANPMSAADGAFDSSSEAATATVDTTGLSGGRHIVYVRGKDADDNWGPVSAVFLVIRPDPPPDTSPAFGDVGNQVWTVGVATVDLSLGVEGGNAPVTCAVTPALPAGVMLDAAACKLSGTPTAVQKAARYAFTATDVDGDAATLGFSITVEQDTKPMFGKVDDPTIWAKDESVHLSLGVEGGNGSVTCAVEPPLPAGITLDRKAPCKLSGRPSAFQRATRYRFQATDRDGDEAALAFRVAVEAPVDDARFVSYAGVPERMAPGSTATVTVRMRNTGRTTWRAKSWFALGSQSPEDNKTWGLRRVPLRRDVPPNAEVDFTFKIAAPAKAGSHGFRWRMVREAPWWVGEGWFGLRTEHRTIRVEADTSPSFDRPSKLDLRLAIDEPMGAVTLPPASGGNGKLSYRILEELPDGLNFDGATRTLSGAPTTKQAAKKYTYQVEDEDGDAARLAFSIEVLDNTKDDASFVSFEGVPKRMAPGSQARVAVRMKNTGTTTWSTKSHRLVSRRPDGNRNWGLKEARLPVDVPPDAEVKIEFVIKAPLSEKEFRWQMRAGNWFGEMTEFRRIQVEDPSFGDEAIADQTWTKGLPVDLLPLPEAAGSGGALTYSLSPDPPAGVTFTESRRTLSGTPKAAQKAVKYTYTATDAGGSTASLAFEIEVAAAPADDASFVGWSGVPEKIAAGSTASVTVTMKNVGTTTWTAKSYGLGAQSPQNSTRWGVRRAPLQADVAPNDTVDFELTIRAPKKVGKHPFEWKMVRDRGGWFGESTRIAVIEVENPSFGDQTIADQTWVQGSGVKTLRLPAATGSSGPMTYAVTPDPPSGMKFDASRRTLSGKPRKTSAKAKYRYTATDASGDSATLTFFVKVEAASMDDAAFVSSSGLPRRLVAGSTASVTVTMKNTGTTTWTEAASYRLGSWSPQDNETWGLGRVSLPGDVAPNDTVDLKLTIRAPKKVGKHPFEWRMVRDRGGWFGSTTGRVIIDVENLSFGEATVADQTWLEGKAIATLTLPAANGDAGGVTYALTSDPPAGVIFDASTRTLSGTPRAAQGPAKYEYTATGADGDTATLLFRIAVDQVSAGSTAPLRSGGAAPRSPSGGAFDMFEYWLLPHGSATKVRSRLEDGRLGPDAAAFEPRSFWRGDLWGRRLALLGTPDGGRFDIFEESEDGLDYWGTFEGGASARPSVSLDRPFRWMNRHMAVGDRVERPITGRLLSNRLRNQVGVLTATMRLEVMAHRESFTVPMVDGLTFQDVLEVRFWPDASRVEAYDEFHLARGYGAVHFRRSRAAAGEVAEWWAVERSLAPVVDYRPRAPWFDPFSQGWPKTAVVNGGLDDYALGVDGGQVGKSVAPGWTADSGDVVIARSPASPADAGSWGLLLRGAGSGGDDASDMAMTEAWIPLEGGAYELSACVLRQHAGDNVFVDFDDGKGRDASFEDVHLVAAGVGTWECRAVTKCIPASVGAVRVRAAREGDNLGDAWFDNIELKRVAACSEPATVRRRSDE